MAVVAISGQPGCGSTTAGKLLAEKLGLKFFSLGNYTKKIALEVSNEPEETKRTSEFWHSEKGSSAEHNNKMDIMQKEMAATGDIVMDAKLAIHMLRGFADFSVWLKADFDVRARRVANRDSISIKEAEAVLREKEKLERDNFRRIYGFDYFDQEQEADIVIDVAEKKPEQIVGLILEEMKERKLI